MVGYLQEIIINYDRICRLHILIECDGVLADVDLLILEFEKFGLKLGLRLSNVN